MRTETGVNATRDKVLFLDVDGVLNSYTRSKAFLALSKPAIKRLEKIVKDTGCRIVLSSTWRLGNDSYARLARVLRYRQIVITGRTPSLPAQPRGAEIDQWLKEHPEAASYAILDDDSDMLDHQLRNFFQTDGAYGLTDTIAYRVIHHLQPA